MSDAELVDDTVAEHLRESTQRAASGIGVSHGKDRSRRRASARGVVGPRAVPAERQPGLGRKLDVHAAEALLLEVRRVERLVEVGVGRCVDGDARLSFVLEISVEVNLVSPEWAADRETVLLVLVIEHFADDMVRRIEFVVAEIARCHPREAVGSGLGDGVHLETRRAALRRIEPARLVLELGNRIAAEARMRRLRRAGQENADLLPVDIELVVTSASAAAGPHAAGLVAIDLVGAVPRGEHHECDPFPALDGQRFELAWIDVAAQTRVREVQQRRLAGHGDGFLQRRNGHFEIDDRLLTDEQHDGSRERRKSR